MVVNFQLLIKQDFRHGCATLCVRAINHRIKHGVSHLSLWILYFIGEEHLSLLKQELGYHIALSGLSILVSCEG